MKKNFPLLALFFLTVSAAAQNTPRLAYVYPAGGKAGSTFQIFIGGQGLLATSNACFSGDGISAIVIGHRRPMNQNDFNKLRDRLRELQDKFQATRKGNATGTNAWTAEDIKERDQIQAKILKNPPNRTAPPAMIDTAILQVSIATNAVPGEYEIRLFSANGTSNPMKFLVGDLPEFTKPEARAANPDLDKFLERIGGAPAPVGTPKYEARINLPAVINGQIMPGGVDHYRFNARRGQRIVITASARSLIPYLADAVPGWFETTLTLTDAKGKELAHAERFRFKPDPVLCFEVPRDGEYHLEIHDSIFRGREDFVYRLTIGELPYVTAISPIGGKVGEATRIQLTGWNLPQSEFTFDKTLAGESGIISLTLPAVNTMPFAVGNLPEVFEKEGNSTSANAQKVPLPATINGCIASPGETDVFEFSGRAGQQIVAEVFARRLDSPLDSFLRLTDKNNKVITANDDFEDKGSGLNTHHADSFLLATLPTDGAYFLHISDTQNQGSPAHAYRVRLSEPQPDFALRVVPASASIRAGMSTPLTAFALRRDGFTNEINLDLLDAPPGFSLSGGKIPAGQDKIQFTLKAPVLVAEKISEISITGRAMINGRRVEHPAIPAEDMMQAFIYRHLVPARQLTVLVTGQPRPFTRDAFKVLGASPVKISPGQKFNIRISTPFAGLTERYRLELKNPPEGILLNRFTATNNIVELALFCDPEKIKPGDSGNLIVEIIPTKSGSAPKKGGGKRASTAVATLPAIPFQVIAK